MLAVAKALKNRLQMDTLFLGHALQPTLSAFSFLKNESEKECRTMELIRDLDPMLLSIKFQG